MHHGLFPRHAGTLRGAPRGGIRGQGGVHCPVDRPPDVRAGLPPVRAREQREEPFLSDGGGVLRRRRTAGRHRRQDGQGKESTQTMSKISCKNLVVSLKLTTRARHSGLVNGVPQLARAKGRRSLSLQREDSLGQL